MLDSVFTTDDQGYVHVLVQNPTASTKQISTGAVVGKVDEFDSCVESGKLVCLESDVKLVGGVGLPGGMADECEVVEAAGVSVGGEYQVCSVEGSDGLEPEAVRKEILEKW